MQFSVGILTIDRCAEILELLGNPVPASVVCRAVHRAWTKLTLCGNVGVGRVFAESWSRRFVRREIGLLSVAVTCREHEQQKGEKIK